MALTLLIIGVAFNVFLGTLVMLKYRDKAARALVFVAIGLIWWELANYMADFSADPLLWNKLTFIGPLAVLLASYKFISELRQLYPSRWLAAIVYGGSAIAALVSLTPLLVPSVEPRIVNDIVVGYSPNRGVMYLPYLAWLGFIILLHVRKVFASVEGLSTKQIAQIDIVRIGTIGAIVIPVVTNLLIPVIEPTTSVMQFVPIMSVVYMGALSVAIIRHKMLDIHDFLIRAAVFSLTNVLLGALYLAPIILLFLYVFKIELRTIDIVAVIVLATAVATSYKRIEAWFIKVSNRLFFQESYDPASLMSDLNRALLSTSDIYELLNIANDVVKRHMASEYCYFDIYRNSGKEGSHIYSGGSDADVALASVQLTSLGENYYTGNMLIVDNMPNSRVKSKLIDHNVRVGIKLRLEKGTDDRSIGYMIIGPKKSGKSYTASDINVIEAISSTLVIAIQDALHLEKITKFNETLQQKIGHATSELVESNKKLRDMDEAKDEFISMASHQLRTPLTSIKGYISMLLDGDIGEISSAQRQALEEAYSSSQRMVYLISDFLNLSRLKTGKFVIERSPVVLAKIIEQEISQLRAVANAKGIKLSYHPPDNFPTLHLDETKVRQVMMNFIDNAIYYSKLDGGKVEIKLSKDDKSVKFVVKDDGIGVPEADQEKLFTKFFRADNARKQRPDGTGIGLFMAKKVITAHGGTMIVESKEGSGSTFGFVLPLSEIDLDKETDNSTDDKGDNA